MKKNKPRTIKNNSKALVMLSGGLDSATCLYWAKTKFKHVSAITFNYYGRLEKEKIATLALTKTAGVSNLIQIDLPFVKEASDFATANMKYGDDRWASYVPARNLIFYSIAAHYAEYLGIRSIIGGHNNNDVSFFKDASIIYFEKMNSLFKEGCLFCNGHAYKVILPLAGKDRKHAVKLALQLNVPIEQTWSCHQDGKLPCGRCYACRQRREAFASLGLTDYNLTR